jgi:hypothetical protein
MMAFHRQCIQFEATQWEPWQNLVSRWPSLWTTRCLQTVCTTFMFQLNIVTTRGSLFTMKLYYTHSSIHNSWLEFTTLLEFEHKCNFYRFSNTTHKLHSESHSRQGHVLSVCVPAHNCWLQQLYNTRPHSTSLLTQLSKFIRSLFFI